MDVACGTGSHAVILKNNFNITGVDINENMLKIAREKVPEANFIHGDMKNLELDINSMLSSVYFQRFITTQIIKNLNVPNQFL